MYVPKHFELSDERTRAFLASAQTAELVTAHHSGPVATMVPVTWRPSGSDGYGTLLTHISRVNGQWCDPRIGEALMILSGTDHYIDPQWMPSFTQNPGVPTWNYVTVHAYGDLIAHEDAEWLRPSLEEMCEVHGFDLEQVDPRHIDLMMRAAVGLELRITRIQAKAKLSQNRDVPDIQGVIDGLNAGDGQAMAHLMTEISIPHAAARTDLVSGIAQRHRERGALVVE